MGKAAADLGIRERERDMLIFRLSNASLGGCKNEAVLLMVRFDLRMIVEIQDVGVRFGER